MDSQCPWTNSSAAAISELHHICLYWAWGTLCVLSIVIWNRSEPYFPTLTVLHIWHDVTGQWKCNSKSTPSERPDFRLQTHPLASVSTSVVPLWAPSWTSISCTVLSLKNPFSQKCTAPGIIPQLCNKSMPYLDNAMNGFRKSVYISGDLVKAGWFLLSKISGSFNSSEAAFDLQNC